jgi:hypothetical protein
LKLEEETLRFTVVTLLAAAAASIAVYLWVIDLASLQRTFGAMLGSELVIFSMALYVYYRPSLASSGNRWLLVGCVVAAAFLLIAVQLGSTST